MNPTGISASNLEKLFFAQYLAFSASLAGACSAFVQYRGHVNALDFYIVSASSDYQEGHRPAVLFPRVYWHSQLDTQDELSQILDRFIQFISDLTGITVAESFSRFFQLNQPAVLRRQAA